MLTIVLCHTIKKEFLGQMKSSMEGQIVVNPTLPTPFHFYIGHCQLIAYPLSDNYFSLNVTYPPKAIIVCWIKPHHLHNLSTSSELVTKVKNSSRSTTGMSSTVDGFACGMLNTRQVHDGMANWVLRKLL